MIHLPETGFLRLRQILGDPTAEPPITGIFPVKKSCWWQGVKTGRFPKAIKFGRLSFWRIEDIRNLIDRTNESKCSELSEDSPPATPTTVDQRGKE